MSTATSATAPAAPVLRAIAPLVAAGKIESASLRHGKLVRTLENATKRGEIEAVAAAHKNHRRAIPALTPAGAETIFAKTAARLIVNQAGGILENAGLSLHRHFNDPIIPGSAVKGVAAHAAWCEWSEAAADADKERVARDYATVFGFPTTDRALDTFLIENCGFKPSDATAGAIAFLPAIPHPHSKPALTVEITNSHHMRYYGSTDERAVALDNEEPNPQFFPAIESDAVFRFTLVPLKKGNATAGADLLALAKNWLLAALTVVGVGAKTAAGYGWFEDVTTEIAERENRDAAARAAEETRRAEEQHRADELARRREQEKQLASMSPEAQEDFKLAQITGDWGRLKPHLTKFANGLTPAQQAAIVRWLASTAGADRWQEIKTEAAKGKKPWSQIIGSIHAVKKQLKLTLP